MIGSALRAGIRTLSVRRTIEVRGLAYIPIMGSIVDKYQCHQISRAAVWQIQTYRGVVEYPKVAICDQGCTLGHTYLEDESSVHAR